MNSYIQFLAPSEDLSFAYFGTYDISLVLASVFMAVFGSFMALELSGRIVHATTRVGKIMWIAPGALALGGGVWAMHFIGMLAFNLPCGITYDPTLTLASMLPGVAASAVAMWVIGRTNVAVSKLVLGGVLMGVGIGTMHYSGMAAMRLDAVIYYSPTIFAFSIVFAVVLATLSLHAKFLLQAQPDTLSGWSGTLAASIFMGTAISGMHYIAMEAAYFIPASDNSYTTGLSPTLLAVVISVITLMLMSLTFAGSILARHRKTILALLHEVEERKIAQKEARDLAMTDHLTGLSSRAHFYQRLDQHLKLADREKKQLALLALDLDRFKPVNDTYGHPVGDALLQAVATTFTKHSRETDLVARVGGDEFAILLVHPDDREAVRTIAQRIIDEVNKAMTIMGQEIQIGTSIGIAHFPDDADNEEDLMHRADRALYEAKNSGRNTLCFYRPDLDGRAK